MPGFHLLQDLVQGVEILFAITKVGGDARRHEIGTTCVLGLFVPKAQMNANRRNPCVNAMSARVSIAGPDKGGIPVHEIVQQSLHGGGESPQLGQELVFCSIGVDQRRMKSFIGGEKRKVLKLVVLVCCENRFLRSCGREMLENELVQETNTASG